MFISKAALFFDQGLHSEPIISHNEGPEKAATPASPKPAIL
jgi:hypothetical protein